MSQSLIRQDSYWFVEGENDDAVMKALCEVCAKKQKKGWLWEAAMGYGDYDLFCCSCKNAIYLRDKNENKANNKNE